MQSMSGKIIRLENASEKAKTLSFVNRQFDEHVLVVGNFSSAVFNDVTFVKGFRIIPGVLVGQSVLSPKFVWLKNCRGTATDGAYPFKISAAMAMNNPIEKVVLEDCIGYGNGKPHVKDTVGSGTPDNFSVQGVNDLLITGCHSSDGGENGFSLNGCKRVEIVNSAASECDGQGLHVGTHRERFGVDELIIDGFTSAGNWKNQLGVDGSSCGVLMQQVNRAVINRLASCDNEHAVSFIRKYGTGTVSVSGFASGCGPKPILVSPGSLINSSLLRVV